MILALVVAPVRVYREGLARAFDGHEGLRVVGDAGSVADALRHIEELGPDVAFVDVSSPAGVAAARAIAETDTKPVALAPPDDDSHVVACVQAGVSAFVGREESLDGAVAAAEAVVRGEVACSPRVVATLLRQVAAAPPGAPVPGSPLTARERQVVTLIDEGLSNKEIAARLCIELSTVKNHVHNALEKLGARGRSEAAARLRMAGS